jgi:hypothetical protein
MQLQPQLRLLTIAQLGDFRNSQVKTEGRIRDLIGKANSEMATIDSDFKEFIGPNRTKLIGTTQVQIFDSQTHAPMLAQVADRKYKVRQAFGEQLRPLHKQVVANVALAKTYSSRHWSKVSCLNRATSGDGVTDAVQRRAAYSAMFAQAGKAELFAWAQLALDTGDAVLADAIYRANSARVKTDRGFEPASFISLMPNGEFTESQTILQEVVDSAKRAGLAIAQFEGRGSAVSVDLIAMGLAEQDGTLPGPSQDLDPFDETGAIRPEYLMQQGKRVSGQ